MEVRNDRVKICDVLKNTTAEVDVETEDFEEIEVEPAEVYTPESEDMEIEVDFNGVEVQPIELAVINDEHGRISDALEALEDATGLAVIPLEMGDIAPEVATLAKHKIYEFRGKRYAMSHRKRMPVIESFKERIVKTLQSGIPFSEELNKKIIYNGVEYDTLALSEDEWRYVMSLFKLYKERLYVTAEGKMILEIKAERR